MHYHLPTAIILVITPLFSVATPVAYTSDVDVGGIQKRTVSTAESTSTSTNACTKVLGSDITIGQVAIPGERCQKEVAGFSYQKHCFQDRNVIQSFKEENGFCVYHGTFALPSDELKVVKPLPSKIQSSRAKQDSTAPCNKHFPPSTITGYQEGAESCVHSAGMAFIFQNFCFTDPNVIASYNAAVGVCVYSHNSANPGTKN
ncbi:hypothetical protein L208DRAFT_1409564 [Tricholoma matsutake]|nr:hypothetical protein L208DRAFT_1409564 [Tricholoma matsutake 945]